MWLYLLYFLASDFCTAVMRLLSEPEKRCQQRLMSTTHSLLNAGLWLVVDCIVRALYTWLGGLPRNVPLLHTSTQCPFTSLHVMPFTPVLASIASNKHWGEKAWERGYVLNRPTTKGLYVSARLQAVLTSLLVNGHRLWFQCSQ